MKTITPLVFRWLLGVVFIWAGTVKLLNPMDFLVSIYGYETHLPETLIRVSVVVLPWLEILTGLALITGIALEAGLLLCASMLVAFVILTGQAWARGLDISCGCFGSQIEQTSVLGRVQFAFFRNLLLLGLTGFLLLRRPPEQPTRPTISPP